jgi:hypothetical protein
MTVVVGGVGPRLSGRRCAFDHIDRSFEIWLSVCRSRQVYYGICALDLENKILVLKKRAKGKRG